MTNILYTKCEEYVFTITRINLKHQQEHRSCSPGKKSITLLVVVNAFGAILQCSGYTLGQKCNGD